jgi:hypothetical protein
MPLLAIVQRFLSSANKRFAVLPDSGCFLGIAVEPIENHCCGDGAQHPSRRHVEQVMLVR